MSSMIEAVCVQRLHCPMSFFFFLTFPHLLIQLVDIIAKIDGYSLMETAFRLLSLTYDRDERLGQYIKRLEQMIKSVRCRLSVECLKCVQQLAAQMPGTHKTDLIKIGHTGAAVHTSFYYTLPFDKQSFLFGSVQQWPFLPHRFLLKTHYSSHLQNKTGLQVIKHDGVCVSACGWEADIPGVSRFVNIFIVSSFPSYLPRGVNIFLHNLFQTTNMFPHLGCRTVATFSSSSSNLPLSDSSLFGFFFKLVILEDLVFQPLQASGSTQQLFCFIVT